MWACGAFGVSNPADCRFIRLTLTDKTHENTDLLYLAFVDFHGTLFE
jgi:hypothetical protein